MPQVSKLSTQDLDQLKLDLCDPRNTDTLLSLRFRIARASVFYYRKKFVPTVAVIYSLPPLPEKQRLKTYEQYLRIYYKKIGQPYRTPPIHGSNGRYLGWL